MFKRTENMTTWDHHKNNLTMCQSEFSIQRRSIGKRKRAAANKFGSIYNATANMYNGGMPFICLKKTSSSL